MSDRSAAMATDQVCAGLSPLLFALSLPLTALSDGLPLSPIGALGVFSGGMIAGYQTAWGRPTHASGLPDFE